MRKALLPLLLLASSGVAHALDVGGIYVQSKPGQPLLAFIHVRAQGGDQIASLQAKLGSRQVYANYGYPSDARPALRLQVVPDALDPRRAKVVLTTQGPISTHDVEAILELRWRHTGQGQGAKAWKSMEASFEIPLSSDPEFAQRTTPLADSSSAPRVDAFNADDPLGPSDSQILAMAHFPSGGNLAAGGNDAAKTASSLGERVGSLPPKPLVSHAGAVKEPAESSDSGHPGHVIYGPTVALPGQDLANPLPHADPNIQDRLIEAQIQRAQRRSTAPDAGASSAAQPASPAVATSSTPAIAASQASLAATAEARAFQAKALASARPASVLFAQKSSAPAKAHAVGAAFHAPSKIQPNPQGLMKPPLKTKVRSERGGPSWGLWAGLAAILVGVGSLVLMQRRRKSASSSFTSIMASDEFEDGESVEGDLSVVPNGATGFFVAGGAMNQSSKFQNSLFLVNPELGQEVAHIEADSQDDPLKESDFLLTQGFATQALHVLAKYLTTHPGDEMAWLKMLQIYASQQDSNGFESVVNHLGQLLPGRLSAQIEDLRVSMRDREERPKESVAQGHSEPSMDFEMDLSETMDSKPIAPAEVSALSMPAVSMEWDEPITLQPAPSQEDASEALGDIHTSANPSLVLELQPMDEAPALIEPSHLPEVAHQAQPHQTTTDDSDDLLSLRALLRKSSSGSQEGSAHPGASDAMGLQAT